MMNESVDKRSRVLYAPLSILVAASPKLKRDWLMQSIVATAYAEGRISIVVRNRTGSRGKSFFIGYSRENFLYICTTTKCCLCVVGPRASIWKCVTSWTLSCCDFSSFTI